MEFRDTYFNRGSFANNTTIDPVEKAFIARMGEGKAAAILRGEQSVHAACKEWGLAPTTGKTYSDFEGVYMAPISKPWELPFGKQSTGQLSKNARNIEKFNKRSAAKNEAKNTAKQQLG